MLALADVDAKGFEKTPEELPPGISFSTHIVDVANQARVNEWAGDVVNEHGCVDIIINNAGVASVASIEEIEQEDFNWVFDICFFGVLYGSKAFMPYLKMQKESYIVNISSVNGFVPFPNNGPYNCAKHAVKALNQTMMQELRNSSVKVLSVHPGGIKTNIARNIRVLGSAAMKLVELRGKRKFVVIAIKTLMSYFQNSRERIEQHAPKYVADTRLTCGLIVCFEK